MWSEFSITAIGWVSEFQIIRYWRDKKVISRQTERILLIFLAVISLISFLLAQSSLLSLWFIQCFGVLLSLLFPILIEFHRRKDFQDQVIGVLDIIILSMKSGKSFREALQSHSSRKEALNFYFSEIFERVLLRQTQESISADLFIDRVYKELLLAEQSQHRVVERLRAFRYVLKIEESFRIKSKQASLQARAQSLILALIYFATAVYILMEYGWRQNMQILLWSFVLFSIGTIWIWRLGRQHQWKV